MENEHRIWLVKKAVFAVNLPLVGIILFFFVEYVKVLCIVDPMIVMSIGVNI